MRNERGEVRGASAVSGAVGGDDRGDGGELGDGRAPCGGAIPAAAGGHDRAGTGGWVQLPVCAEDLDRGVVSAGLAALAEGAAGTRGEDRRVRLVDVHAEDAGGAGLPGRAGEHGVGERRQPGGQDGNGGLHGERDDGGGAGEAGVRAFDDGGGLRAGGAAFQAVPVHPEGVADDGEGGDGIHHLQAEERLRGEFLRAAERVEPGAEVLQPGGRGGGRGLGGGRGVPGRVDSGGLVAASAGAREQPERLHRADEHAADGVYGRGARVHGGVRDHPLGGGVHAAEGRGRRVASRGAGVERGGVRGAGGCARGEAGAGAAGAGEPERGLLGMDGDSGEQARLLRYASRGRRYASGGVEDGAAEAGARAGRAGGIEALRGGAEGGSVRGGAAGGGVVP